MKDITDDIELEATRIAKWLEKIKGKDEDYRDYFVSRVIMNFDMDLFESLGLLEYVKLEIVRIIQTQISDKTGESK